MGDDFKVGDVVVCVDVAPRGNWPVHNKNLSELKIGAMYRVDWTGRSRQGVPAVLLSGVPFDSRDGRYAGFDAKRFRKLRKADDSFIRQLRTLTPKEDNHA